MISPHFMQPLSGGCCRTFFLPWESRLCQSTADFSFSAAHLLCQRLSTVNIKKKENRSNSNHSAFQDPDTYRTNLLKQVLELHLNTKDELTTWASNWSLTFVLMHFIYTWRINISLGLYMQEDSALPITWKWNSYSATKADCFHCSVLGHTSHPATSTCISL